MGSKVSIETSVSELIDRITILENKTEKLRDISPRDFEPLEWYRIYLVEKEDQVLSQITNRWILNQYHELRGKLIVIHETLWELEDRIRASFDTKDDSAIAVLAWQIHYLNDKRAAVKKAISKLLGESQEDIKFFTTVQ